MKCTFFGHSNTSEEMQPKLESLLIDLIENYNVDIFYVGNQGNFDFMVRLTGVEHVMVFLVAFLPPCLCSFL